MISASDISTMLILIKYCIIISTSIQGVDSTLSAPRTRSKTGILEHSVRGTSSRELGSSTQQGLTSKKLVIG
jgi:hypothetical protein